MCSVKSLIYVPRPCIDIYDIKMDLQHRIQSQYERKTDPKFQRDTNDMPRKLSRLVIPWAIIVIISVGAAIGSFNTDESQSIFKSETHINIPTRRYLGVYHELHEPLFPLETSDKIGFVCVILGLMVAAGGGIGGGGILVPVYILMMGFSPKHAIPLSNITVFGGAVANVYLNSKKRHPLADRPLVDWDLILIMEPLTIAGALMGAFLNKILRERFLASMLVVLLSYTSYNTLKKAIKMYKLETLKLRELEESELTKLNIEENGKEHVEAGDELLKNMELQEGESPGDGGEEENFSVAQARAAELEQIIEEERTPPSKNINILLGLFVVVLAINLLKGGGAFPSPLGIQCGSPGFWISTIIMLVWILLVTVYVRSHLVEKFERKELVGFKYVDGDIKWDRRATVVYPSICCLAGFFAGMFGVGGGIVKGPLMLAMGVHPAVASASSACMILFTSFTATTSFYVFGLLDRSYSPVCFVLGVVSTYVGQIGLSMLMKKSQRNSYIAFSIGGVVLLSAFLMTIQSILSLAEGEVHKAGGICGEDT